MTGNWVFAADTIVRFRGGRILIHTGSSPLPAFECNNPMLVGWLCQFAQAADSTALLAQLQPPDRQAMMQVLDYLQRSGALVPAGAVATGTTSADEAHARARNHLRLLARSIYDAACDLLGLGPAADQALEQKSGVGVERRLMALLAGVDGLRTELQAVRAATLAAQMRELGVDASARGLKLHIGCGKGHLPGWINIDVHPAPLAMNVLRGLPFADAAVTHVFVSHLLEHLYYPRDVRPFLAEVLRVLAPGGVVRIVVPDIQQCIEAYTNKDREFFASRRETWPWWPDNPTRLEDFLAYAGAGPEPAYLFEAHKYGYDFETLERVLAEAGFTAITPSTYMASAHPELRVDDVSAVARAMYGQRYYSLFIEASRTG
jgi:predicted SAM-dependent methyltransferase